ncbi:hypothetical protein [Photobacterium indicum]|uniref:Uncharacterized protein n=1 Tax=Photobacterium indicum TaxID=81447 RepID=A0A2T3LEP2_9GAMM|nr:hypothetical protein [Photobacterium indicum]PSV49853.1 hypothetical protein C9J47_04695 [Photobacterium indicum]
MDFLSWTISEEAISGAAAGGLVSFLLKSWFETRLKKSIKHEYDSRLLKLKSDIEKESNLINILQSNYSNKNNASHDRILTSIESIWAGILYMKKFKPTLLGIIDLLHESELGTELGRDENPRIIDINQSDIDYLFCDELDGKLQDRLYAGEYLWSLFFSYRQLIGRISIVNKKGREEKDVPIWWEDNICKSVISALCSKNELSEFNKLEFGRVNWILNHIESKYLEASKRIITGEESINLEAELATKVIKALEKNGNTNL